MRSECNEQDYDSCTRASVLVLDVGRESNNQREAINNGRECDYSVSRDDNGHEQYDMILFRQYFKDSSLVVQGHRGAPIAPEGALSWRALFATTNKELLLT